MRLFLLILLLFVVSACAPARDLSLAPQGTQRIVIWHKQSGEKIDVVTRSGGQYNRDAFDKIDYIFRDRHTDEVYPIDPKLIDVIADLRDKLLMSPDDPIELLSGYRSAESNANLAKVNRHVAKNSFHMKGQAADIRIPTMNASAIEAVAKTMQKGGVALYPDSGHIHVDTGPVRGWSVIRGQEAGMRRSYERPAHYHGRVPVMPDTQYVKPLTLKPALNKAARVKGPANSYDNLPQPGKSLGRPAGKTVKARKPAAPLKQGFKQGVKPPHAAPAPHKTNAKAAQELTTKSGHAVKTGKKKPLKEE